MLSQLHKRLTPWLLTVAAAACGALVPATASAGSIQLKTVFAGPIAASSALCTAEPRGLIYGTTNYNPAQPLTHRSHGYPEVSFYTPANAPSWIDLVPELGAGARSDLCVGFTLPPDVESPLVRDWFNDAARLQDDPAWPDVPETHVAGGALPEHGDDLRSVTATLPAGYAADFASAPQCSESDFGTGTYAAPACPAGSQVGEAFVRVTAFSAGAPNHAPLTGVALTNLVPATGEVGRLGLSIKPVTALAPVKWTLAVRFAGDGSGRLVATLADAARFTFDAAQIAKVGDQWDSDPADVLAPGDARIGQPQPAAAARPLYVEGLSLRLWGSQTAHPTLAANFGAQAGRCTTSQSTQLSATTYAGTASSAATDPYTLVGCESLPMPATATVTATSTTAASATGATVALDLPQTGTGLPAQPTTLEVALPTGLALGPQLASGPSGQPLCSAEQFAASSASASACAAATAIGTVELHSLTGATFDGSLFLGPATAPTDLAAVYADVTQGSGTPRARLKLVGSLGRTDAGQVRLAFPSLPALRLTGLELTLRGGEHALLTAPTDCGDHAGSVTLGREGGDPVGVSTTVTVDGCAPPAAGVAVASTSSRTGQPATSVSLTRSPVSGPFEAFEVQLPPGLLVAAGAIPACGAADAAAGTCSAAAQLGGVSLALGAGPAPLTVNGDLFLTDAQGSALPSGVIIASARLGELDLGQLVAPVSFGLRSDGRGLTLRGSLPAELGGVPLDVRTLTVDLDRGGVVRQPTACGPLPTSAVVTAGGQQLVMESTVSYPSCGGLGFSPDFAAGASGDASLGGHPKLVIVATPRATDSGLAALALTLPESFGLDLASAPPACPLAAFQQAACSPASQVGQAAAKVSISADTLGGGAYLVAIPGEPLPAIGLQLAGAFGHQPLGRLATTDGGAVRLTFGAMPDLPLSRLALQLDGGDVGVLANVAPTGGCPASPQWAATFVAHNGAVAARSAPAGCSGAGRGERPLLALSMSRKTGIKLKLTQFGGRELQAVKLSVPRTIRVNAPKAKRRGRTKISLIGSKATPRFTSRSITLTPYGGVPSEVVLRLRTAAYTVGGKSPKRKVRTAKGKRKTVTYQVRLAYRDGTTQTRKVKVRLP